MLRFAYFFSRMSRASASSDSCEVSLGLDAKNVILASIGPDPLFVVAVVFFDNDGWRPMCPTTVERGRLARWWQGGCGWRRLMSDQRTTTASRRVSILPSMALEVIDTRGP